MVDHWESVSLVTKSLFLIDFVFGLISAFLQLISGLLCGCVSRMTCKLRLFSEAEMCQVCPDASTPAEQVNGPSEDGVRQTALPSIPLLRGLACIDLQRAAGSSGVSFHLHQRL